MKDPYKITIGGDLIVETVIEKIRNRSEEGQIEYKKTLERDDFTPVQWAEEYQTEVMDATLYAERNIQTARLTEHAYTIISRFDDDLSKRWVEAYLKQFPTVLETNEL